MANHNIKVCPVCWQGKIVGRVCSVCHRVVAVGNDRRADALPLGTILKNRYQIGEVLGNGGFGITYSSWDRMAGQRVAIKELYPKKIVYRGKNRLTVTPIADDEAVFEALKERFEGEASILSQLQSERNLVKVFDLFSCNGTVYYSMEFLEGSDLQTIVQSSGPMDWSTLVPMISDLLQTLSHLHARNLIHRDISPDNLFLTTDRSIRLIDFGSVRTYQGTRNFTVYLKEHFSPWEQYISNGKQGPWTDIYSLSVTLYYLLSGKLPAKAAERKDGAKVPPVKTLVPSVPSHVSAAIEKGMALSIEDRFPDAAHFAMALGIASQSAQLIQTTELSQPPQPIQPPPPRDYYWILGQTGLYTGRRRILENGTEIRFGRTVNCQVLFPENFPGVSRRQCSLFVKTGGLLFAKDDGSTYGTYLNGQRLPGAWTLIQPGCVLQFGNETFRVFVNHSIDKGNVI